jgi:hypothetical protein
VSNAVVTVTNAAVASAILGGFKTPVHAAAR